jgi:hypothetical protein
MSEEVEEWREIPGFPGYAVSSLGRVRSYWKGTRTAFISDDFIILKQRVDHHGYPDVFLRPIRTGGEAPFKHKRLKTIKVHKLVMRVFVGPRPAGLEVAHGDGNPLNSKLSNLRYATKLENENDKIAHGTRLKGELVHNHKLTEQDVLDIWKEYNSGTTSCEKLAAKYSVHHVTIVYIISGRTWKHLKPSTPTLRRRGNAQLTEDQVREILKLHKTSLLLESEIAEKLGISQANVNLICRGRAWTHIADNTVATVSRCRGRRPKFIAEGEISCQS